MISMSDLLLYILMTYGMGKIDSVEGVTTHSYIWVVMYLWRSAIDKGYAEKLDDGWHLTPKALERIANDQQDNDTSISDSLLDTLR